LLKQLDIFKAKAFLDEFHKDLLHKRLQQLKESRAKELARHPEHVRAPQPVVAVAPPTRDTAPEEDFEPPLLPSRDADMADADGSLSPVLIAADGDEPDVEVVDPEADARELEEQRRRVLETKQRELLERNVGAGPSSFAASAASFSSSSAVPTPASSRLTDDALMAIAKSKAEESDEEDMAVGDLVELSSQPAAYWWHDKYRPRKPRFFNRVKTGFDWNKYNQVHYDKENPPPKVVQGYKFNVFYPDLIDPSKPPTFQIEPDPQNPDYCTIRFTAGPPYEDLAFRIVNKEWEFSHRKGYKCSFDRGVLHLYFNFKRYWYRK